jgi:hypothetical protein
MEEEGGEVNWDAVARALLKVDPVFKSDEFATSVPFVAETLRKMREFDAPTECPAYQKVKHGMCFPRSNQTIKQASCHSIQFLYQIFSRLFCCCCCCCCSPSKQLLLFCDLSENQIHLGCMATRLRSVCVS